MPYRLSPKDKKVVQVKKGDKWITLKSHLSAEQAVRHLRALKLNVTEEHK